MKCGVSIHSELMFFSPGCKNESFKFVGVHLDENLNWNHHLKAVKNKASSAVSALSSVKNFLPSNIKLTIYNSLYFDHLLNMEFQPGDVTNVQK